MEETFALLFFAFIGFGLVGAFMYPIFALKDDF